MKLNLLRDKYQERMFIITSIIRLLSLADFTTESVTLMNKASKTLREVEEKGGVLTDDSLFKLYTDMEEQ